MIKKPAKKFLLTAFFTAFIALLPFAALAANVNLNFLTEETSNPGEFVNNFYKFALGIAGAAAFAVIIWGAILYTSSAGSPSGQQNAKSWIMGAIWGVVLLLAAYLILYTINPNLVDLTTPDLEELDVSATPIFEQMKSKDQKNRIAFQLLGISVNNPFPVTNLGGLRPKTINEIKDIADKVGSSNITITGGTEAGHADGDNDHSEGYKFDLRTDPDLHNYIINNFEHIPDEEKTFGIFQYRAPSGAIYTREANHWDVLVK